KAHVQAGVLPGAAGRSTGGRPSPAADSHSFSNTIAAGKRKGVDAEEERAELCPSRKQSPYPSRGGVPAPAAHPGPAPAPPVRLRSSKRRGKKML
ncbi:hypothetical protein CIB84_016061, partial [Bambusicola thoracicus]